MGHTQFTPNSIPRNIINMKFLIGFTLLAVANAVPIELTLEVAQATKEHLAAHAAASAGDHAALAPVQGPAFYNADDVAVAAAKPYLPDDAAVAAAKPYVKDTDEVAAAKVEFKKYFDAAAAGKPLTPVTLPVVAPVAPAVAPVAPQVVATYNLPATLYSGYQPLHYSYPYAAYPYYTGFHGLPVLSAPVVAAPAAKEDAVVAEE